MSIKKEIYVLTLPLLLDYILDGHVVAYVEQLHDCGSPWCDSGLGPIPGPIPISQSDSEAWIRYGFRID